MVGHVSRMPHEKIPKQALLAKANGKRPAFGQPRLNEPIALRILDGIASNAPKQYDGGDGRP